MNRHLRPIAVAAALLIASAATPAIAQNAALENLPPSARSAFQTYLAAEPNKAFAASPDGSWGWQAGAQSIQQARVLATQRCQNQTRERCVIIAADAQVRPPAQTERMRGDRGGIVSYVDVPVMSQAGREAYQAFLNAEGPKAFAASPAGAWGWQTAEDQDLEEVAQTALARCMEHDSNCSIVAAVPGED